MICVQSVFYERENDSYFGEKNFYYDRVGKDFYCDHVDFYCDHVGKDFYCDHVGKNSDYDLVEVTYVYKGLDSSV